MISGGNISGIGGTSRLLMAATVGETGGGASTPLIPSGVTASHAKTEAKGLLTATQDSTTNFKYLIGDFKSYVDRFTELLRREGTANHPNFESATRLLGELSGALTEWGLLDVEVAQEKGLLTAARDTLAQLASSLESLANNSDRTDPTRTLSDLAAIRQHISDLQQKLHTVRTVLNAPPPRTESPNAMVRGVEFSTIQELLSEFLTVVPYPGDEEGSSIPAAATVGQKSLTACMDILNGDNVNKTHPQYEEVKNLFQRMEQALGVLATISEKDLTGEDKRVIETTLYRAANRLKNLVDTLPTDQREKVTEAAREIRTNVGILLQQRTLLAYDQVLKSVGVLQRGLESESVSLESIIQGAQAGTRMINSLLLQETIAVHTKLREQLQTYRAHLVTITELESVAHLPGISEFPQVFLTNIGSRLRTALHAMSTYRPDVALDIYSVFLDTAIEELEMAARSMAQAAITSRRKNGGKNGGGGKKGGGTGNPGKGVRRIPRDSPTVALKRPVPTPKKGSGSTGAARIEATRSVSARSVVTRSVVTRSVLPQIYNPQVLRMQTPSLLALPVMIGTGWIWDRFGFQHGHGSVMEVARTGVDFATLHYAGRGINHLFSRYTQNRWGLAWTQSASPTFYTGAASFGKGLARFGGGVVVFSQLYNQMGLDAGSTTNNILSLISAGTVDFAGGYWNAVSHGYTPAAMKGALSRSALSLARPFRFALQLPRFAHGMSRYAFAPLGALLMVAQAAHLGKQFKQEYIG